MQAQNEEKAQADDSRYGRSLAALVADHVEAMLAYWDKDLVCRFANKAYLQWFGRNPEDMIDIIRMPELLGPLFEKNLPYIRGALAGERQTFEREIPVPTGGIRYSLANYYPDFLEGKVAGFYVHVADITPLKLLAREQERLVERLTRALKEIRTLKGLLPICAWCKKIRDDRGYWNQIETYITEHSDASFTHGICTDCERRIAESVKPP
jgi:hypothetical protein